MQPYMMLIGAMAVPITPSKITTKYKGQNSTVELIDGSVINKLNPPGLAEYSFSLVLPKQTDLPFSNKINNIDGTQSNHYEQDYYLNYFYDVFKNNKVVIFTVWRTAIGGGRDMGVSGSIDISGNGIITSKSVTIESYSINEEADNGLDITLDLELKEYVGYGTQKITYTENTETGTATASTEATRESDSKEIPATYTVKSGDCLINICKSQLGDANKWQEIAQLNGLENANKIYPGQVLKLR